MARPRAEEDDYDDDWEDRRDLAPHRGVAVLLLGIFGLKLTCGILGVVAFFMGRHDLREMDAGRMDPSGRGMTLVGYVFGIISMVVLAIGLVFFAVWLAFVVAAVAAH
jgi:hypothetical protein